jgi:TolB-like protein
MLLLARDGRQAAAIEAAEAFAARLASELGIAPSDDLAGLSSRIRAGGLAEARRPAHAMPRPSARRRIALLAAASLACLAAVLLWLAPARFPEAPAGDVSLLVRPFEAGDGVRAELAQGFADDLATELVRRSGLDVLSRESGRLIPDTGEAASGASHVLGGRMRADADRWVLNVWITETGSGREIWADRLRGSPEDPRAVRDEVLTRISDRIGVALSPVPDAAPVALPQDAVPAYLRTLSLLHSGTPEGNAAAIAPLRDLAEAHPEAVEPVAGLVLAHERIAFEADDYARAAGLHWLEGYLTLKRHLASVEAEHPDLLAARARLALRRLDHAAAGAFARRAIAADAAHVAALEVLARSLALTGETAAARRQAIRAITLSPAAPEAGYTALALAAFADGDMDAAADAVDAAFDAAREGPLQLLALRAAIFGLGQDATAARDAFGDLVAAVESRPFGAWRIGDVTFTNPRAATWRRPSAAEAAGLIRFDGAAANARLLDGLLAASGEAGAAAAVSSVPLGPARIEDLLFNRQILGRRTWLVQHEWSQTRTETGTLFQGGAFGPLPGARQGRSDVIDGRLCDRWTWDETEIENCQVVVRDGPDGNYALIGETGRFPFVLAGPAPDAED